MTTCTVEAPAEQSAAAAAEAVDPVVYTSSTSTTQLAGSSPAAAKAPRTLRRRSATGNPACRGTPRVRTSSRATSRFQRGPSSRARASAGCPVRRSWRRGSGGIYVMTSAGGRSTCAATSSAARTPARRRPCSFHARTSSGAGDAYATAARADANARRRPAHSRHLATGQAVGAPHSAQHGSLKARRRSRHPPQTRSAAVPQDTQRRGKRMSNSHALHATRRGVTCLCRLCEKSGTSY